MSEIRANSASIGLNLDSSLSQKKEGELTFAMNAMVESFDGNSVNYQNENANVGCIEFPKGYRVVGIKNILEKDIAVVWLANPETNDSEIGTFSLNDCTYKKAINDPCLGLSVLHPIHKAYYKVTSCTTEVYWTDGNKEMRWIDLENLPFLEINADGCENIITNEVDCNKIRVQPRFSIPKIEFTSVDSGGSLIEGAYQFTVQYANSLGDSYTAFYGLTDHISIFNPFKGLTQDFNTVTDKSITLEISGIDVTGVYDYINIAVIKTINDISTPELIETRRITDETISLTYTGISRTDIRLSMNDVFETFPIYEKAEDIFTVQDVLGWSGVTTKERISYQKIANKIKLLWQTHKLPVRTKGYKEPLYTAEKKGYMRDEVYPFDLVLYTKGGAISDRFHIPGREAIPSDRELITNLDGQRNENCKPVKSSPRWQVYNTASLLGGIKNCIEKEPTPKFGSGSISLICSDNGCTHQGANSVVFKFDVPTPEPIIFQLGEVYKDNTNTLRASGFDIFSIPIGAIPDPYYAQPNLTFTVNVPAGVTTYTVQEPIFLQGTSDINNSWICHDCLFPIQDLYIKSTSASNYKITLSSDELFNIHNIYPEKPYSFPSDDKGTEECADDCYDGPFEYGEFAYTESTDTYPCNVDVWGELADKPIRHHKFPDSSVTHIHDDEGNIYPIGIKVDIDEIKQLIRDSDLTQAQKEDIIGFKIIRGNRASANQSIVAKGLLYNVGEYRKNKQTYFYPNYPFNDLRPDPFLSITTTGNDSGNNNSIQLKGFEKEDAKKRMTFHSPDTHFSQPSLGDVLKLETVEYGTSKSHMVQVKDHARYKFLRKGAYNTALVSAILVGIASNSVGLTIKIFDGAAAYAAFSAIISIIDKTLPRINFAYQFNALGDYAKFKPVANETGNKVRALDISSYLIPGMTGVADIHTINNYQRESSVYLRATDALPFPHEVSGVEDNSRWTISSEGMCDNWGDVVEKNISAYYGSVKRFLFNQYGTIHSYEAIDTGFYSDIDVYSNILQGTRTVFGGDTYINKFALKRKLSFFLDNKVRALDDSDIAYDELANVAHPTYWFSTDYQSDAGEEGEGGSGDSRSGKQKGIARLFGVKINNFDCRDDRKFYQNGKMYLFAYGIPYFFCESQVNVDYRQAFNDKEGDFYPHVGEDIPDDWLQETRVQIIQDNTYVYNKSYSRQIKENNFTSYPEDYDSKCFVHYPNKAIYSDQQKDRINYQKNNWLIYRPISYMDFPLNFGKLISIEGMENRAILAKFENKSLIYDALLTVNTNTPLAAYIGDNTLFRKSPPIDFAESDLGFNGSQHKFHLRSEYGAISADTDRGQIYIISGNKATSITNLEYKVEQFFLEHLPFKIKKYFPNVDIDNHFNGIGLHGVIDNRFKRFIFTKLDYIPIIEGITYEDGVFKYDRNVISVEDKKYFEDVSFSMSFDLLRRIWVSFHSYKPNFYMEGKNTFYSGLNEETSSLWRHDVFTKFNNFYGEQAPYIIEYPFSYKMQEEIVQSVSEEARVLKQINEKSYVTLPNAYFNKAVISTEEQTTGVLNLIPKPLNSPFKYLQYPKFNVDSKDILFTKSDNFYNYNGFWDIVKNSSEPVFIPDGVDAALNPDNLDYSPRVNRKHPIRGKSVRIRHILDNTSDVRIISHFLITTNQISYK